MCICYSFAVYFDIGYEGQSLQQGTGHFRGSYTLLGVVNGMPNYLSNFDNGKYSIWNCPTTNKNFWVIGYTRNMPNCLGFAYR